MTNHLLFLCRGGARSFPTGADSSDEGARIRPVAMGGMGWQMPPLNSRAPEFCHPWENAYAIYFAAFSF